MYFLLKLRDSKPSEHAGKINLRNILIYTVLVARLGLLSALCACCSQPCLLPFCGESTPKISIRPSEGNATRDTQGPREREQKPRGDPLRQKVRLYLYRWEAIAFRLEAIASRLEAIALRLEAIALRLEAMD